MVTINFLTRLTILTLILLTITIFTITRTNQNSLAKENFQINIDNFAINFYDQSTDQAIIKISPFDDYYYSNLNKQHLVSPQTFQKSQDLTDWLFRLKNISLLKEDSLFWRVEADSLQIDYQLFSAKDNAVKITRSIDNTKEKIYAIGQSIIYCDKCLVMDQKQRVYLNQDNFSQEKINFIKGARLIPVLLTTELLPENIEKIIVLDNNFNTKFTISINPSQQVLLDEKWHLLEVKTPIPGQTKLQTTQIINFNK